MFNVSTPCCGELEFLEAYALGLLHMNEWGMMEGDSSRVEEQLGAAGQHRGKTS